MPKPILLEVMKARAGITTNDLFAMLWAKKLRAGSSSVQTLTGIPPLSFKSDGTPLTSVTIKGNGIQNGTPSPQNIVPFDGTGERTGNLFDKSAERMVGNGAVSNELPTGIRTIIQTAGNNKYTSVLLTRGDELLGKTLTISATITPSAANNGNIRFYWLNNKMATSLIAAPLTVKEGNVSGTFTIPNSYPSNTNGIAIVFSANVDGNSEVGDYVDYTNVMLNTGSTALPYEPFGCVVPITNASVTTPLYLGEVSTTRRIKKLVLTGEETIPNNDGASYNSEMSTDRFVRNIPLSVGDNGTSEIILCTHLGFQAQSWAARTKTGCCIYCSGNTMQLHLRFDNTTLGITQSDTNEQRTEKLKAYLAAQYAAGHPVTVWYVLATEQTGIINEPLYKIGDYSDTLTTTTPIPTAKGSNTLSVDTTVQPSEVGITGRIKAATS